MDSPFELRDAAAYGVGLLAVPRKNAVGAVEFVESLGVAEKDVGISYRRLGLVQNLGVRSQVRILRMDIFLESYSGQRPGGCSGLLSVHIVAVVPALL